MRLLRILIAASLLSSLSVISVAAQEPTRAVISARAYATLPPGAEIRLKYLEDTELNLTLRGEIESLLLGKGFEVGESAPYVLAFEPAIVSAAAAASRVEISGLSGEREPEHFKVRITLPPRKVGGSSEERRYRLKMTLAKAGEPPFWVGLAAAQKSADRLLTTTALARELIDSIGQTVESRSFAIQ